MNLEKETLLAGLNALGRAWQSNYFVDGHRGAAIIAGVYLCREQDLQTGAVARIRSALEESWIETPLCAPFPPAASNGALLGGILDCMAANLPGLREAGHNVILPTLALKALREAPQALTPAWASGLCRLIAAFKRTDFPTHADLQLPDFHNQAETAEFILQEFVLCSERFQGRGQGWSGHLLTYGRAILDLVELGYPQIAAQARDGFARYVSRIRTGPLETDGVYQEHAPLNASPFQAAYWERGVGDYSLGHVFKYPYAFYGLIDRAKNKALVAQCHEIAYRVL